MAAGMSNADIEHRVREIVHAELSELFDAVTELAGWFTRGSTGEISAETQATLAKYERGIESHPALHQFDNVTDLRQAKKGGR